MMDSEIDYLEGEHLAEIARLKARETELLATCNKYLEEAREARQKLREKDLVWNLLAKKMVETLDELDRYRTSGTPLTKAT